MRPVDEGVRLIGGIPSSGSTLLSHRLGSLRATMALPETGLFAHGHVVAPDCAPSSPELGFAVPWLNTAVKVSQALGWPTTVWSEMLAKNGSPFHEVRRRIDPEFRHELIEKTPENVFAFEAFLRVNTERRVVLTTRDVLGVVQSLLRRGFNLLEAFLCWAAHGLKVARLLDEFPHRVFHCRYEDLTRDSGRVVREIAAFWGLRSDKSEDGAQAKQTLLTHSSWQLEDTAWCHRPSGQVVDKVPVNLVGLAYSANAARLAVTAGGRALMLSDLNAFLGGRCSSLGWQELGGFRVIEANLQSGFTRSLFQHYPLVWRAT